MKNFSKQIYSDNVGEWYVGDILSFIKEAEVPVDTFSVSYLAKLAFAPSEHEQFDEVPGSEEFEIRADESDLSFPIIVVEYGDESFIADGNHRLRKAQKLGLKSIRGYRLDNETLHKIKTVPNVTTAMLSIVTSAVLMEEFAINLGSSSAAINILKILRPLNDELAHLNSLVISGRYDSAIKIITAHVLPRGDGFFIRKNYDYGEAWPKVLDEFRRGKVKNVVDMAKKLRRWKGDKSKENVDISVDIKKDIDRKKILQRAELESLIDLNSYCGSDDNAEYWNSLLDTEGDDSYHQAIEEFIEYATKEIEC